VRVLLEDLGLHELAVRLVLLDGSHSEVGVPEGVWDGDVCPDSRSGEYAQGGLLSLDDVVILVAGLVLFLDLGGVDEGVNIRRGDHEVEGIAGSTGELDWADGLVAVEVSPLGSHGLEALEHRVLKLDQGLGDDRLVLSMSSLDSHHGWKWASSSDPLGRVRIAKVLHARHVAGSLLHHEVGGIHSDGVAIGRVEVGGQRAPAFVSEEVTLGLERSLVDSDLPSILEFLLDHQDQEPLSVDLGDLNVTVRISVEKELGGDGSWQSREQRSRGFGQGRKDVGLDISGELLGENLVDLSDEHAHLRDELDEALWHQDHTVVLASLRSPADDVCDLHGDVLEGGVLRLDLLSDERAIDSGLEGAFQDDVRG